MNKNNQSGFSPILIILAIAVVIAMGLLGWRVWETNSKHDQSQQSNSNSSSPQQPTPTTATFILHVKELSINLTLPNTLADISYAVTTNGKTDDGKTIVRADFSTKKIASLDPACGADGVAPPLGDLTQVAGQYPTNPNATNSGGMLVKQFPAFYIGRHSLQAQCSASASGAAEVEAKTARTEFAEALSTLRLEE